MINTWRTAPRNCFSGGYTGAPVQPMSNEDRAFWRLRKDRAIAASGTGPAPYGLRRDASQAKPLVPIAWACPRCGGAFCDSNCLIRAVSFEGETA